MSFEVFPKKVSFTEGCYAKFIFSLSYFVQGPFLRLIMILFYACGVWYFSYILFNCSNWSISTFLLIFSFSSFCSSHFVFTFLSWFTSFAVFFQKVSDSILFLTLDTMNFCTCSVVPNGGVWIEVKFIRIFLEVMFTACIEKLLGPEKKSLIRWKTNFTKSSKLKKPRFM